MLAIVRRRVVDPVLGLLRQGLSPRDLAVLGVSTPALTLIALWQRLNLAAIQLVSWLVGPVQLVLIIPFMRLGEWVLGSEPQPMTIEAGMEIISQGILQAIVTMWDAIVHASVGWILIGPLAIFVLYRSLIPVLERALKTLKPSSPQ
jgi:uncharacterized protein (DUF2062 family)